MKKFIGLLAVLIFLVNPAAAEDDVSGSAVISTGSEGSDASAEASKEVSPFGLSMHIGTVVRIDPDTGEKKTWSQIRLLPEMRLGRPLGLELALGLDIALEWDEENKLNDEEWNETADAVDKILYVRWGSKKARDPFHITLGGLRSVTIGHGLIMGGYSNMVFFPDVKFIGISSGVNTAYGGLEGVVDDIDRTAVAGGRVYITPFKGRLGPIGDRLSFGGTCVIDQRTGANELMVAQAEAVGLALTAAQLLEDEDVMIYGADEEFRIIDTSVIKVIQFTDVARIDGFGHGIATGLLGSVVIIDYKLEYRIFDPDFFPNYFNNFYMAEAPGKRLMLEAIDGEGDQLKGYFGMLGAALFGIVDIRATYEEYERPPIVSAPNNRFHGELTLNNKFFQVIPKVPNIEARGSYDKVHILDLDDFFEIEDVDTLVKGELLYHMNPNLTIAYIYEKRFEEEDGIIGGIESTTVQTRIHF